MKTEKVIPKIANYSLVDLSSFQEKLKFEITLH
jgi:hypothetical protein